MAVGKSKKESSKQTSAIAPTTAKTPEKQKKRTAVFTPPAEFTKQLAAEIVKNLAQFRDRTFEPLRKSKHVQSTTTTASAMPPTGEHPILADTSILIDGRIVPIINSGFFTGTILIPQFVLGEVQHIADSMDALRRAKGRRGLDVVTKIKDQKVNPFVSMKIVSDDLPEVKEVDHKLVALAKQWKIPLMTVDFNLAQVARAQNVRILNVNDLAQALKVALMPGEEMTIKITHEGKERSQGVGYLADGTMVIVEDTKDRIGQEIVAIVTKVHQTPAGQLFFARLR